MIKTKYMFSEAEAKDTTSKAKAKDLAPKAKAKDLAPKAKAMASRTPSLLNVFYTLTHLNVLH